jgi:pimeloyl-ACP methyl ester carboxylesterase
MKKKILQINKFLCILFLNTLLMNTLIAQQTNTNRNTEKKTGYAPVNGLKMYYEIHGEGEPLVLLHGSYMTIDLNYSQIIPELAKHHKVIALEFQGHGRTADIDREYSWDAMADDVVALLKYLNINNADILGYSFGATVGLELTIKHPELVNKLVFISSVYKFDGWIQSVRDIFPGIIPEFFEATPLKTEYNRLAPDTAHWKPWVRKLARFDATSFDLGIENVKTIKCPVLIIKGDNDGVDLEEINTMYKALGGGVSGDMAGIPKSQLAIIPATSHVTLMMATTPLLNIINPFLDKAK